MDVFMTDDFKDEENLRELTPEEERIIVYKGTEPPFSGEYYAFFKNGVYTCKRCNAVLFSSKDKFKCECGWPAFDDEIKKSIIKIPESDTGRTEICCKKCGAHLGHVFKGEHLTEKNTRYCVNSLSLLFVPEEEVEKKN